MFISIAFLSWKLILCNEFSWIPWNTQFLGHRLYPLNFLSRVLFKLTTQSTKMVFITKILSKQYEIQNAVINTIDIMVLKFENKYTCKYINDFVQNEICWGNRFFLTSKHLFLFLKSYEMISMKSAFSIQPPMYTYSKYLHFSFTISITFIW